MPFSAYWTREGRLSGPGNLLNNRWETRRITEELVAPPPHRPPPGRWGVWDRRTRTWEHTAAHGYKTMREARQEAERLGHACQCGCGHPGPHR